ncbi:hypothetical protein D3C76_918800 [compost metagenome]
MIAAAVSQLQLTGTFVLVFLELAPVGLVGLFEGALAIAAAVIERAGIVAARRGQFAQALEQALGELPAIDLAIAAVPLALPVPLAILEGARVPAAIGIIDAPFTLQQAVDDLAPVAAAVGQPRIRRRQRFAIAAGSEQQDQGER